MKGKDKKVLPEVKILIIEDTPDHLSDMKEIVNGVEGNKRDFSMKIDSAKTKEEAEKILLVDKNHYHVLIVDIMLGKHMDGGIEIIKALNDLKKKNIKDQNGGDKGAILVITSTAVVVSHRFDGLIRQRARNAGVKAYFPKPIPIKEFRKILLETIQNSIRKGEK
jgi:CheY-like chemotaxis protein